MAMRMLARTAGDGRKRSGGRARQYRNRRYQRGRRAPRGRCRCRRPVAILRAGPERELRGGRDRANTNHQGQQTTARPRARDRTHARRVGSGRMNSPTRPCSVRSAAQWMEGTGRKRMLKAVGLAGILEGEGEPTANRRDEESCITLRLAYPLREGKTPWKTVTASNRVHSANSCAISLPSPAPQSPTSRSSPRSANPSSGDAVALSEGRHAHRG